MGCKYNLQEFKPFVSGKKKIIPAVSDDWELINASFASANGVAMKSEKLNCTIYDLEFGTFINFLKTESVTMNGSKIVGSFAIGQRRVLRKGEDFDATMKTKTKRLSTNIPKKEWKIGYIYETACGEILTYVGYRYIQKIIPKRNTGIALSKLKKEFFAVDEKENVSSVSNRKFVREVMRMPSSNPICDGILRNHADTTHWDKYIIFSKTKPNKDSTIKFEVRDSKEKYDGINITKHQGKYKLFSTNYYITHVRELNLEDVSNITLLESTLPTKISSNSYYSRDVPDVYNYQRIVH